MCIKQTKGFTIVELAIVLVVIGIVLSMAVKGKRLVDVARFRKEVNKIYKLEAAMHIWLATTPDFTLHTRSWGDVELQDFYNRGIISESELISDVEAGRYGQAVWTPEQCIEIEQDGYRLYNITTGNNAGFCAMLMVESREGSRTVWYYPTRLQCGIEVILDDENIATGRARRSTRTPGRLMELTNFTREEYADCFSIGADQDSSMWYVREMAYKIY